MLLPQALKQKWEAKQASPTGFHLSDARKSPAKLGRHPVSPDKLRARLGPTTWRVWWHCERKCSGAGFYFEAAEKAAAELGLSVRTLRKSFERLHAVGLMEVACRRKANSGAWVVSRIVYGLWGELPEKKTVLVPAKTAMWLRQPETRGGARAGAGRPTKKAMKKTLKNEAEGVAQTLENTSASEKSNRGQQGGRGKSNRGHTNSNRGEYKKPTNKKPYSFSLTRKTDADYAASNLESLEAASRPEAGEELEWGSHPAERSVAPAVFESEKPISPPNASKELGTGLHGKAGRELQVLYTHALNIPELTMYELPPVTIPKPPKLPQGLTDEQLVARLLKAYRGCYAKETKKPCFVYSKIEQAKKSKHWKTLVTAAKIIQANDWRVGAWVMWRFSAWAKMHDNSRHMPPVHWVFNPEAMENLAAWYESEEYFYSVGNTFFCAKAKAVMARYDAVKAAIRRNRAFSAEAQREIFNQFFPGNSFYEACIGAAAAAKEDQAIINAKAQRGDWLW